MLLYKLFTYNEAFMGTTHCRIQIKRPDFRLPPAKQSASVLHSSQAQPRARSHLAHENESGSLPSWHAVCGQGPHWGALSTAP